MQPDNQRDHDESCEWRELRATTGGELLRAVAHDVKPAHARPQRRRDGAWGARLGISPEQLGVPMYHGTVPSQPVGTTGFSL